MSSLPIIIVTMVFAMPSSLCGPKQTVKKNLRHGESAIVSVRFMRDDGNLISASFDGTVARWDLQTGKRVWEIDLDAGTKTKESHTISEILDMDLSPDGSAIAVAYDRSRVVGNRLDGKTERRIGLLDVRDGREIRVFLGHAALVGTLAFSPDGRLLVSASADRTARLWNTDTGQQIWSVNLKERGQAVAFSRDGRLIAIGTQAVSNPSRLTVELRNTKTGGLEREFTQGRRNVDDIAFSPKGKLLALATDDLKGAQIDLWDLNAREPERTLTDHEGGITSIAFSSDGRLLASGDLRNGHGNAIIRELGNNAAPRMHKLSAGVSSLSFAPNSSVLAVGTDKGQIVLIQL